MDRAMVAFTVRLEAHPRGLVPDGAIPDLFVPLVNESWQRIETASVVHVLLANPGEDEWAQLGAELLAALLEPGCDVGLCLDGEWPGEIIRRWLRETEEQDAPAVVDLQWKRAPREFHPVLPQTTQNVRWISFHRAVPPWLQSIWAQVDRDRFHVGSDLMVAAYPASVLPDPRSDEPATIASFGRTLHHASGWMIPLDSNRGYAVGIRDGTPLDAMLRGSARSTGSRPNSPPDWIP